jgi:tripartite-type tricarboxylate transporter receptor subunit TctC
LTLSDSYLEINMLFFLYKSISKPLEITVDHSFLKFSCVRTLLTLLVLSLIVITNISWAQSTIYPAHPIKLIVPFPPGGATDVIGRIMAQELSKSLSQQVLVENKSGDSGNLGAELVAKSQSDGYTLLLAALTSHSINANLEKASLRYDLEKDFSPVAVLGVVPLVFVVNPSLPIKNMKEFISYAKANPGKLTFASSGAGAPQRLAMEMFRFQEGLDMLHIPYKGSGPAMTDLVGGQVLCMSETVPAAISFIQSGKLRALAVSTSKRISQLPDVPTVIEATGVSNFDVVSMFGILAPTGTPKAIVNQLSEAAKSILLRQDVQDRMLTAGVYTNYLSPSESTKRIHAEMNMWAKVIKDSNVKLSEN